MPISEILFWLLSALAVISAIGMLTSKNPVHSALLLIVTFCAVAGHYLLLNSEFLFAVQIIVYAGAIMVLFLYMVMMLNFNKPIETSKVPVFKVIATIASCLLLLVMVGALRHSEISVGTGTTNDSGSVQRLGQSLFNEFLLPFEISSLLFLAAMVGAVYLNKKELAD